MSTRPSEPENSAAQPDAFDLSPADAGALDALIESGWSGAHVSGHDRRRAERLDAILELLEPAPSAEHRSTLIDVTLARVLRAPAGALPAALTHQDADALAQLVASGWNPEAVSEDAASRAAQAADLLALLGSSPLDPASRADLVQATLDRVVARRVELGLDELRPAGRGSFRLRDLVAAAAIFIVSISVVWPAIVSARESSRRAECEAGMMSAGLGFGSYAGANRGELPRSSRSLAGMAPGVQWWVVGDPRQSHSANLFTLVVSGYATLNDLACAGNPLAPVNLDVSSMQDWRRAEEVSYSYQLFNARTPQWDMRSRVVVLTDRSPAIDRVRRGEPIDPTERSHNHRAMGQNVLFNDGSVQWMTSPDLANGDNLWTPRSWSRLNSPTLRSSDRPADDTDAFVGP